MPNSTWDLEKWSSFLLMQFYETHVDWHGVDYFDNKFNSYLFLTSCHLAWALTIRLDLDYWMEETRHPDQPWRSLLDLCSALAYTDLTVLSANWSVGSWRPCRATLFGWTLPVRIPWKTVAEPVQCWMWIKTYAQGTYIELYIFTASHLFFLDGSEMETIYCWSLVNSDP